ncbi:MAG TPA: chorismate mutase [Gemmatimonadaceae bacterium]|jgi:chorismate mutase|nr:chorismate mutase [Gemmatimonadaceae bacterium]
MGERHVRAIRGATTVARDDAELIRVATRELLEQIVARNALVPDDIISVVFTVTADLTSEFPAHAARALGWVDVPLLCTMEIPVPGSLQHCIRILLHIETDRSRDEIAHVYLRGATVLRPDLVE